MPRRIWGELREIQPWRRGKAREEGRESSTTGRWFGEGGVEEGRLGEGSWLEWWEERMYMAGDRAAQRRPWTGRRRVRSESEDLIARTCDGRRWSWGKDVGETGGGVVRR